MNKKPPFIRNPQLMVWPSMYLKQFLISGGGLSFCFGLCYKVTALPRKDIRCKAQGVNADLLDKTDLHFFWISSKKNPIFRMGQTGIIVLCPIYLIPPFVTFQIHDHPYTQSLPFPSLLSTKIIRHFFCITTQKGWRENNWTAAAAAQ